jgi:hypothetical protein
VLAAVCDLLGGHPRAIEFGLGWASTPWLIERTSDLTSVETHADWYHAIVDALADSLFSHWRPIYQRPEQLPALATRAAASCPLAFVDCIADYRLPVAMALLEARCPFVVIHDWEQPKPYRYKKMRVADYTLNVYRHTATGTETAVFSTEMIVMEVSEHDVATSIVFPEGERQRVFPRIED